MSKQKPVPESVAKLPVPQKESTAAQLSKIATGTATAASLAVPGGDVEVGTIRVRALQTGYYGWMTRREGDVFDIAAEPVHEDDVRAASPIDKPGQPRTGPVLYHKGDPKAFSPFWMEKVDQSTPIRITTSTDAMRQHHDELNAIRFGATGEQNVLG